MIMSLGEYLQIKYTSTSQQEDDFRRLLPFAATSLFETRILSAKCLTRGEDVKKTYDVAFDKTEIKWNFQPGDAIGVLPENDGLEVEWILRTLDLSETADQTYRLSVWEGKKNAKIPAHLPTWGTLRTLFQKYLDIRSVPKRSFLKHLAKYTVDDNEKKELHSLADPKQGRKYTHFINSGDVTLFALLQRFPSCKPPIERLLEHLPALKPRFYSVSSSSQACLREFHITFSVIEAKSEISEFAFGRKGVCTGYLEHLIETNLSGAKISFYFRTNSSFLIFDNAVNYRNDPIILIGPGVGFAPFKGFLDDRLISLEQNNNDFRRTGIYLFTGCRYANRDFLYKDDIDRFLKQGVLKKLFASFSRDAKHKSYVQDAIKTNGEFIAQLLCEQNAFIRLCGDAKQLTKSVDEALIHVLTKFSNFDEGEALDFITENKRTRRYCTDIWN